jgi:dihydrofolate reductase (trimethoprim resistance protein)
MTDVAVTQTFAIGDRVEKISGSSWRGLIVGTYSTSLTPEGYAVESETETGSVQIYPAKALRLSALQPRPAFTVRAEALEEAAKLLEDVIGRGYSTPTNKTDKCPHDKFGWEDCIACYDDVLSKTVAEIRALAEPARGEEG